MVKFLLLGCAALFTLTDAAKVPKDWKVCKNDKNLNVCIKKAFEEVLPILSKGVPSLGIFPLDPLHFDSLRVGKGSGPIKLDLTFKDFDLSGLGKMNITSMTMDWKTMKANAVVPVAQIKGGYRIEGQMMLLPVKGDGDCVLDFENLTTQVTIYFSTKGKGSKAYYNIDKIDLPLQVENMKLKFNNLFNGDKRLGDQMNAFFNENFQEIFKELQPSISQGLAAAYVNIGNRIFSKIPKDSITPP